jgi:hypothetical protein
MLTLIRAEQDQCKLYTAEILGPCGIILMRDLTWIVDRADILEVYYWEAWAVLQGAYHCCFSIPGKVTLLPPNEPGR